jgi:DNA-3-methyladenine glycosylase
MKTQLRDNVRRLPRTVFQQPATELAEALLGTILVRQVDGRLYRAQVVETEAYIGTHDLACHAAKGRTARTEVMFAEGGVAYVYLIYGMHHMLNVVASVAGDPQAVLLRGAAPLDDWQADLSGPGKLARHFRVDRTHNGMELTGDPLHFIQQKNNQPLVRRTKRIGVEYAQEWKDAPLRFIDARHVKK